jgi:hypothetical protein
VKTVRIFLPYGAHLRFNGVDKIQAPNPEYIAFTYTARDEAGNATDTKAHAVFCTKVICGYSVEEER